MTREQLLDAVGDIRDAFIREAAPPPASYRKQREFPWTGAVYVQAGGVGRHPEACPEGFSYAGEAELPDTGELCPYYADPERPGQIYVYQSCWDEGTGTTYMAYVRYEAETTN